MAELTGGSAGIQLERKGICKQLVLPLIVHPSGFICYRYGTYLLEINTTLF